MTSFIYLNSNKSGLGDRLLDLILIYTYSQYLKCNNLYLHWTEDINDMTGNKSYHSRLRKERTPFRSKDYLLLNLKKYIILPDNIYFISKQELIEKTKRPNNLIFTEYTGLNYTLYSFIKKRNINDEELFKKKYFENLKNIKFKNIPDGIINYFKNNNILTVHLRRGDKVCNDGGAAHGIKDSEINQLNTLTEQAIYKLNSNKIVCFISDEKKVKDLYYNKFKDKFKCIIFNSGEISQTYYDLYSLVNSKIIILSQSFSVFSIFASLISHNNLYYVLNNDKIKQFSEYDNINIIDNI